TSRYSFGDWKNEISQENYHEGHGLQLLWIYKVNEEPIFKEYEKIFLESDRSTVMLNTHYTIWKHKILNITASHTIDSVNHGVNNLIKEVWVYVIYWNSYKSVVLSVDFGEIKRDISALTLNHVD